MHEHILNCIFPVRLNPPYPEGCLNPYIQSVILGIVEGLTEFLPVSSTAHLRIVEAMMKIPLDDAYWAMYTIVIQAGAILALMLLYLTRILTSSGTFPRGEGGDKNIGTHPISLTIIAFICTSIPALLLKKWSDKHLAASRLSHGALVIGAHHVGRGLVGRPQRAAHHAHRRDESAASHLDRPLPVASAIFPGTSRVQSTIAAGQLVGLDRPTALEFSFLLSIPTMLAATAYDLLKELHPSRAAQLSGAVQRTWQ